MKILLVIFVRLYMANNTILNFNSMPTPGTWSGNQTITAIQTNTIQSGISHVYMQDSQITGWAIVVAYVSGKSKTVQILGTTCAIRMHTDDGSTWWTSKWGE